MFRFTERPSSGIHNHYLANNTGLVQCRYRRRTVVVSVRRHNMIIILYTDYEDRRHIQNFRRRRIAQTKKYNIHNRVKDGNQEFQIYLNGAHLPTHYCICKIL
jgi:hypothetical protein